MAGLREVIDRTYRCRQSEITRQDNSAGSIEDARHDPWDSPAAVKLGCRRGFIAGLVDRQVLKRAVEVADSCRAATLLGRLLTNELVAGFRLSVDDQGDPDGLAFEQEGHDDPLGTSQEGLISTAGQVERGSGAGRVRLDGKPQLDRWDEKFWSREWELHSLRVLITLKLFCFVLFQNLQNNQKRGSWARHGFSICGVRF